LKYDTYGSVSDFNGDWPSDLEGMYLPLLQLPNSEEIHSGATEESSLHLLECLDGVFLGKPLWRLIDESGQSVWFAANAYAESLSELEARESPRAAWLFCQEEWHLI
jgi:hypothetical protein